MLLQLFLGYVHLSLGVPISKICQFLFCSHPSLTQARQNFEHSLKVRQGLTGRARAGGDGGIFGGVKKQGALTKQGKPRPDAPFAVPDSPMFERQQSKENYDDQVQKILVHLKYEPVN